MTMNYRQRMIVSLLTLGVVLFFATAAYAHGVVITYTLKSNGEVELYAEFDTGEAMSEAQVTIYSPDDPLTPWLTGVADAEGRYVFVIDPELPGIWDVQFRKAGHGDMAHLQLEAGMVDPALLDQEPGELMPVAPVAEAESPAETGSNPADDVDDSPATNEAMSKSSGTGNEAANQATAGETDSEIGDEEATQPAVPAGTGADVTAAEAEAAMAEAKPAAEAEPATEKAAVAPESAVEPEEATTQARAEPGEDAANTPAAARATPPASVREEAAVVSAGGSSPAGGGFSSLQILLMSASVVWGFVGTALYFSNRKPHDHDHHR